MSLITMDADLWFGPAWKSVVCGWAAWCTDKWQPLRFIQAVFMDCPGAVLLKCSFLWMRLSLAAVTSLSGTVRLAEFQPGQYGMMDRLLPMQQAHIYMLLMNLKGQHGSYKLAPASSQGLPQGHELQVFARSFPSLRWVIPAQLTSFFCPTGLPINP